MTFKVIGLEMIFEEVGVNEIAQERMENRRLRSKEKARLRNEEVKVVEFGDGQIEEGERKAVAQNGFWILHVCDLVGDGTLTSWG